MQGFVKVLGIMDAWVAKIIFVMTIYEVIIARRTAAAHGRATTLFDETRGYGTMT